MMNDETQRHLRTLFGAGTMRGVSDGQLLERFAARDGPGAERAFACLVERHGPMVLRVARSILRNPDAADDAFQAAFLALARRAGSLWVRDSIGPWLHAVTVRVASRMRIDLARRRLLDDRAAALAPTSYDPPGPDDLGAALHAEIARLPDRHRLPIVLCLVEGLTHDQAADRLGWPVGTVRSRLARGRDRLRDRLARRGLAPSVIPPGSGLGLIRPTSEAVRASLVAATARAAVSLSNGGLIAATGMVPAGAIAAAIAVLKETSMIHRVMLILGLVTGGVLAAGATLSAQSKPEDKPDRSPPTRTATRAASPSEGTATVNRVYQVGDLVMSRTPQLHDAAVKMSSGPSRIEWVAGPADFGPLIELITETVAPGTWTLVESRDGIAATDYDEASDLVPGSIRAFYPNLSLIVTHSPEVHERLARRLGQFRRLVGQADTHGSGQPFELEPDLSQAPTPDRMGVRLAPLASSAPTGTQQMEETRRILDPNAGNSGSGSDQLSPQANAEAPPAAPRRGLHSDVPIADPAVVLEDMPTGRLILDPSNLPATKTEDTAKRIDALEQKLDAILEELRAIRKDDR